MHDFLLSFLPFTAHWLIFETFCLIHFMEKSYALFWMIGFFALIWCYVHDKFHVCCFMITRSIFGVFSHLCLFLVCFSLYCHIFNCKMHLHLLLIPQPLTFILLPLLFLLKIWWKYVESYRLFDLFEGAIFFRLFGYLFHGVAIFLSQSFYDFITRCNQCTLSLTALIMPSNKGLVLMKVKILLVL